jgi:hypothetical protein
LAVVIRTGCANLSGRFRRVTMSMEQLEVASRLGSSPGFGDDVVDFHHISIAKEQFACPACPLLSLQESIAFKKRVF